MNSYNLRNPVLQVILSLCFWSVEISALQAQTKTNANLVPGVYITGGTVTDSATKKAIPNIKLYCISNGDTAVLTSNARGEISGDGFVKGTPDSIIVQSATGSYHVTYTNVKVGEHGKIADSSGVRKPFYFVEITVKVAEN